jgi:hypothetical protein
VTHANGLLFPIEGALSGIILGGTRLSQLCVLFIPFCALQVAAFTAARIFWNSRVYGYIALGSILSQGALWFQLGGGLFGFRMDFLAYCFMASGQPECYDFSILIGRSAVASGKLIIVVIPILIHNWNAIAWLLRRSGRCGPREVYGPPIWASKIWLGIYRFILLIRLTGFADYSRLQKIPTLEATIDTSESSEMAPASFQRADNYYEIRVNTSSIRLPPAGQVHIRLRRMWHVPESSLN